MLIDAYQRDISALHAAITACLQNKKKTVTAMEFRFVPVGVKWSWQGTGKLRMALVLVAKVVFIECASYLVVQGYYFIF
jgi:hypothetical protein